MCKRIAGTLAVCLWLPAASGGTSDAPAPPTIGALLAEIAAAAPNAGRVEELQRILAEPMARSASARDLYSFHMRKAFAAREIGDSRREIDSLKLALEAANRDSDPNLREEGGLRLAAALVSAGRFSEAVALRASLDANDRSNPGRQAMVSAGLVHQYLNIGDVAAARISFGRARAFLSQQTHWPTDNSWQERYAAGLASAHAALLEIDGKADEAEAEHRKAIESIARVARQTPQDRAGLYQSENSIPSVSARIHLGTEMRFAMFLMRRNRLAEAEVVLRGGLQRTLARVGSGHVEVANVLLRVANLMREQGRFFEAVAMYDVTLSISDRIGTVPQALTRIHALRGRGQSLGFLRRWTEALDSYERIGAALADDPVGREWLGYGDPVWGLALIRRGRAPEAVAVMRKALVREADLFGPYETTTAIHRGVLGMALGSSGARTEAREQLDRAVPILMKAVADDANVSPARSLEIKAVLDGYVEFLLSEPARATAADIAEAFRIADSARDRSVQRALSQWAARAGAVDPRASDLVRKEQDLQQELRTLYDFLVRLASVPAESRLPTEIARFQAQIADARERRRKVLDEIARRLPDYSHLVNPEAPTLEQARKALRPDEVLVSIHSTEDRTFVWAIDPAGQAAFHSADVGETGISALVHRLRAGLTLDSEGKIAPFDFEAAHSLFARLLGPVASTWRAGTSITVIAGGSLAHLPLSILTTRPHAVAAARDAPAFRSYREAPWLARQVAITYAPSIGSYVRLRELRTSPGDRASFIGFGDPVFSRGSYVPPPEGPAMLRSLKIPRVSARQVTQPTAWMEYGRLPPLPDTRDEILAIARALGVPTEESAFLGARATRKRVKETRLDNRRVVMFATHGLLPRDLPNLDQPALALSITDSPESPALTLEDILGLKLNADIVVLSACNTAAADGESAEALSGLGRAFFYAGSRSLLVTHWPVETVSARLLTTEFFRIYASDPTKTRAGALQEAMIGLLDAEGTRHYSYAHPLFWGPFALIGNGDR